MARLRHIAVCVKDLDKAAAFYEQVFEFKKIAREDLEIGSAIYMSDGVINMALLNFAGSKGSDLSRRQELRRRAPFRHPGRGPRRDAEEDRSGRRQVLLRPRRRARRQLRAQIQGPRRRDLRHLEARLAGHRQLFEEVAIVTAGYFFFRADFLAGRRLAALRFTLSSSSPYGRRLGALPSCVSWQDPQTAGRLGSRSALRQSPFRLRCSRPR